MTRQLYPDPLAGACSGSTLAWTTRHRSTTSQRPRRRSAPRPGWSAVAVAVAFLSFARPSLQQHNPVGDFCRRFGHQTAVVDDKLIIDGGFVDWNSIPENPQNYTNTWLSYHDLSAVASSGMPQLYANLSKNGSIPNVDGGTLWTDDVNKRTYLFGGEYLGEPPTPFNLYSYDVIYNQWNNFGAPSSASVMGVSFGAGTSVSDRGEGYYYGGWMSNTTIPNWNGPPVATANLVKFSFDSNAWVNTTGPDSIRRAEGVMVYVPASDGGMLVYFGGVQDLYGNGTITGQPTSQIFLYDVLSGKWYVQNATGDVPPMRRRFCAGATWAADQSSYNIYLYGGLGIPGFPNPAGFDDVYVLSLPSFTWVKMYPLDREGTGDYPHHSLSCNVINGAQMLIIGGTFPLSEDCDAPSQWGVHNMDLGKQNNDSSLWALYSPNKTSYVVPPEILSQIGGGPNGGASKTAPAGGFGNADLKVLMTRKASVAARTPTRAIPTPTGGSGSNKPLSTGAIAGIAVGGAVLLLVMSIGCFCVVRRHRRRLQQQQQQQQSLQPHGYPGSHTGFNPHDMSLSAAGWSPHSSHFSPTSPPYRPQTVPPHTGPPVELPVADPNAQYVVQQGGGGYFHEAPPGGYGSSEAVKYDDSHHPQGPAGTWAPQTTTVAALHPQSPAAGGSPAHDPMAPLTPSSGWSANYQQQQQYHRQQYGSPTASATPPLRPMVPQELEDRPGTGHNGPGPRHQTYYHP